MNHRIACNTVEMTSDQAAVSTVLAQRLRALRRAQELSRVQLAERCAELGAVKLTTAAITNIESGRPDADGNRRRCITVDELMVFVSVFSISAERLLDMGTCAACLDARPAGFICRTCGSGRAA